MADVLVKLFEAICQGRCTDVEELLQACGSDINAFFRRHTAITWALECQTNDVIVRLILTHPDFDPGVRNQAGRTGLWEAAKEGRASLVRSLLDLGAAVDQADLQGVTPLGACALYNRHHAAQVLLEHGADVNCRDRNGDTALHRACASGAEDVVRLLLTDRKCDVNSRNNALQTPLMVALPSAYNIQVQHQPISQSLSICRRLLEAGSDVCATDRSHQTALHERVRQEDVTGACLLLHYHAHVASIADAQGNTALKLAVDESRTDLEVARYLLYYGADPSCLLSAASRKKSDFGVRALVDLTTKRDAHTQYVKILPPLQQVALHHKLRFLEALVAAVFVTRQTVTALLGEDFLTAVLEAPALIKTGQGLVGEGSASPPSATQSGSAGQKGDALVADISNYNSDDEEFEDTTQDDAISGSTAGQSRRQWVWAAVQCVKRALQDSLSLQHQCRLAVRRALGSHLLPCVCSLRLPRKVQNYVTLGVDMVRTEPWRVAALHVAVADGDVAALRRLLQEGVDPNAPFMESSPLTRAVEMEPEYADDLASTEDGRARNGLVGTNNTDGLPRQTSETGRKAGGGRGGKGEGCEPEVASPERVSNLVSAADDSTDDVIEVLIRHGASWSCRDPQGDTPLHVAARRGQWLVRKLLAARDKFKRSRTEFSQALEVKDSFGLTPMQTALLAGQRQSVRLLLEVAANQVPLEPRSAKVADFSVRDPASQPPQDRDQRPEARGQKSDTRISCLHCAAAAGAARTVQLLLATGADVSMADRLGNTPLHAAACKGLMYSIQNYCPDLTLNFRPLRTLRCWPFCRSRSESPGDFLGASSASDNQAWHSLQSDNVQDKSRTHSERAQHFLAESHEPWLCKEKEKERSEENAFDADQSDGDRNLSLSLESFLDVPEVSYRATTRVLLSHGADVSVCNSQGLDTKRLASQYSIDFSNYGHEASCGYDSDSGDA